MFPAKGARSPKVLLQRVVISRDWAGSLEAFLEEVTANLGLGGPSGRVGDQVPQDLQYDGPRAVRSQPGWGLGAGQGSPGSSPPCLFPGPESGQERGPFHHTCAWKCVFQDEGRKQQFLLETDAPTSTTNTPTREAFGLGWAGLSGFVGPLFRGPTQPPSCRGRGPSGPAALPWMPHLPSVTSGVYTCPECAPLTVGSGQGLLGGRRRGNAPVPRPGWGGKGGSVGDSLLFLAHPPGPQSALPHRPAIQPLASAWQARPHHPVDRPPTRSAAAPGRLCLQPQGRLVSPPLSTAKWTVVCCPACGPRPDPTATHHAAHCPLAPGPHFCFGAGNRSKGRKVPTSPRQMPARALGKGQSLGRATGP